MNNKPTILVLEDTPEWQETLRKILTSEGYSVIVAGTLAEAEAVISSQVIDVAVVDIVLKYHPDNADGMKFLDVLSKYYADDRFHAVMLSGHGTKDQIITALTKPQRFVTMYFEKVGLDKDKFVTEIALAVRTTQDEREARERVGTTSYLSQSFLDSIRAEGIVVHLVPDTEPWDAKKDLGLLLRQLLLGMSPLAQEVCMRIDSLVHILCWSRRLVSAFDIVVGRRGDVANIQPDQSSFPEATFQRTTEWSTRFFDGVAFRLEGVSYRRFVEVVMSLKAR